MEHCKEYLTNGITFLFTGAFAKPAITTVNHTHGWALLKCKVLDAYPQPSVVWCDTAGNDVSENKTLNYPGKDGHYNIILYTNVTKSDTYTCIAKQATLHHESKEHTYIYIAGKFNRMLFLFLNL